MPFLVPFSKKGKAQPCYARYVIRVAKLKQSDQKLLLLHRYAVVEQQEFLALPFSKKGTLFVVGIEETTVALG